MYRNVSKLAFIGFVFRGFHDTCRYISIHFSIHFDILRHIFRYTPIHFDTFYNTIRHNSIHFSIQSDTFRYMYRNVSKFFERKITVFFGVFLFFVRGCWFAFFRFLWVVGCLRASGGSRGLDACGALGALGAGRPKYRNAARQRRCKCWGGRAAEHVCAAVLRNLCKYSRQSR